MKVSPGNWELSSNQLGFDFYSGFGECPGTPLGSESKPKPTLGMGDPGLAAHDSGLDCSPENNSCQAVQKAQVQQHVGLQPTSCEFVSFFEGTCGFKGKPKGQLPFWGVHKGPNAPPPASATQVVLRRPLSALSGTASLPAPSPSEANGCGSK